MKKIILLFSLFFFIISNTYALELVEFSSSAILMESSTGKILYEKDADKKHPPASMTKIMSMILIMDAINNGAYSMNDKVTISENASKMGGSQVFLNAGDTYKVSELFKAVAVSSANDAVVALAEKTNGSTEAFVEAMNKKCMEIGCTNTLFKNPHGLDEEGHVSSAKDMALMAKYLIENYKEVLDYTSIYEDYLKRPDGSSTWLVNTNKLVRFYEDIDGLKTGFTESAGYCLTATANKNNMRIISVVMGADSPDNRTSDTVKLMNYAYSNYKLDNIFKKNKIIDKIRIEKGKKEYVDIVLMEDASIIQDISEKKKDYIINIKNKKLVAPINKGDKVGVAEIIDNEGLIVDKIDITVKESIEKANLFDYIKRNLNISFGGKILNNSQ